MNFTTPRYAILFLNSEIYIMYVINHEWNRSMFVVCCFHCVFCLRYKIRFSNTFYSRYGSQGGVDITDVCCTTKMIPTSWGSAQTTPVEGAHDEKMVLYDTFCLEVDTKFCTLFCTYVVMHFVNDINVMYFGGFPKLIKWTIQLHVNCSYSE